jgi:hypothetical protein
VIPPFDDNGYLPPGIHRATLEEVAARFGRGPELRRVPMESLTWLVDLARRVGAERLIVNGSFVTDVREPNDVDCVLLIGAAFPNDAEAERELDNGLPFLQIDVLREDGFHDLVTRVYATDRHQTPKGLIEVIAWN